MLYRLIIQRIIFTILFFSLSISISAEDQISTEKILKFKSGLQPFRPIVMQYDDMDRLISMQDMNHEDGEKTWDFLYGSENETKTMQIRQTGDWSYNERMVFDYRSGLMTRVLVLSDDFTGDEQYEYDSENRINRISWDYEDAKGEQNYSYKAGKLKRIIQTVSYGNEGESTSKWTYFYDDSGRVETIRYTLDDQAFGDYSELEYKFSYKDGNLTEKIELFEEDELQDWYEFKYDQNNHLTGIDGEISEESFYLRFDSYIGMVANPVLSYFTYFEPLFESVPMEVRHGFIYLFLLTQY